MFKLWSKILRSEFFFCSGGSYLEQTHTILGPFRFAGDNSAAVKPKLVSVGETLKPASCCCCWHSPISYSAIQIRNSNLKKLVLMC
jgi:hypothetical protein